MTHIGSPCEASEPSASSAFSLSLLYLLQSASVKNFKPLETNGADSPDTLIVVK